MNDNTKTALMVGGGILVAVGVYYAVKNRKSIQSRFQTLEKANRLHGLMAECEADDALHAQLDSGIKMAESRLEALEIELEAKKAAAVEAKKVAIAARTKQLSAASTASTPAKQQIPGKAKKAKAPAPTATVPATATA